jgi:hypothetical protein
MLKFKRPHMTHQFLRLLVVVAITLTFFSCNDEPQPKDSVNPAVAINISQPNGFVKGTISVQITITDHTFEKAELFVDGVSSTEFTDSSFQFTWNTRTVADGEHTIKVVATDNFNNKGESTTQVEVLNNFIVVSVPLKAFEDTVDEWFFVSNSRGDLLGVQHADNDADIIFETPDNYQKGEVVVFHAFSYRDYGTHHDFEISSFTEFNPGNYNWLAPVHLGKRSEIGTHQWLVTNCSRANAHVSGPDVSYDQSAIIEQQASITTHLLKNNTNLLCVLQNDVSDDIIPIYKMLANVSAGEIVTNDEADFDPMVANTLSFDKEAAGAGVNIFGIDADNNYVTCYSNYFYDNNSPLQLSSVNAYYPGTLFSQYASFISYSDASNGSVANVKYGDPITILKRLDAKVESFTEQEGKVTILTTGEYDFMNVSAADFYSPDLTGFLWQVFMPQSDVSEFTVPQIPAVLLEKYSDLVARKSEAFEFVALSKFNVPQSHLNYLAPQGYTSPDFEEEIIYNTVWPSEGGKTNGRNLKENLSMVQKAMVRNSLTRYRLR